ncbi:hypothetical protein HDU98_010348 [Podochytrium sp. JEL0797]|nr:hypothetical protein HDU98_010348 [Podochytrium sp. JEL0797]
MSPATARSSDEASPQPQKTCFMCYRPAHRVCGGCNSVNHCDKECQKIHWKLKLPGFPPHKSECCKVTPVNRKKCTACGAKGVVLVGFDAAAKCAPCHLAWAEKNPKPATERDQTLIESVHLLGVQAWVAGHPHFGAVYKSAMDANSKALGLSHSRLQKKAESAGKFAVNKLKLILETSGGSNLIRFHLCKSLHLAGAEHFEEAAEHAQILLKEPAYQDSVAAHHILGQIYLHFYNHEAAIPQLEKAVHCAKAKGVLAWRDVQVCQDLLDLARKGGYRTDPVDKIGVWCRTNRPLLTGKQSQVTRDDDAVPMRRGVISAIWYREDSWEPLWPTALFKIIFPEGDYTLIYNNL